MWNHKNEPLNTQIDRLTQLSFDCLKKLWRVVKDNGTICWNVTDIPNSEIGMYPITAKTTLFMIEQGYRFVGSLVWQKNLVIFMPVTCIQIPIVPSISHEYILLFNKNHRKIRGKLPIEDITNVYKSVWDIPIEHNRPDHPCPYPLELAARCIRLFSIEGDTVLDPFMGSGTTAVACKKLGRNFIGFEIEEKNIKIANERLSQVQTSKPNFGGYFK